MTFQADRTPSVEHAGADRRLSLCVPTGTLLVVLGVVLSPSLLEWIILPEGTLVGASRRGVAWAICRVLLAGVGTYLLVKRPRITALHLYASLLQFGIFAAFVTVLLQFLYTPTRIESGWRSFAPQIEQNQLGFRGHQIAYSAEDYVIVLVGDSQVEAMALAFESMPERLLESALNGVGKRVKVVSLGAGGYGQDQQLLALGEYFQNYRADLVIVWETPQNDVWNNVFPTHMFSRNPKPTYWLQDGELRGPNEGLGQSLANSRIIVLALWQRYFDLPRRDQEWESRLPEPYQPLDDYSGPVNREWQERWDTNRGMMRDENLATEKSHLAIMLSPRSKRMQYGLDLTRALLKRIERLANSHDAKLVLFQVDANGSNHDSEEVYPLNGKYYQVSTLQFAANVDYLNHGFQTENIPVTVKDWRVSPEDGHLNRQANDQVMRDLGRRLQTLIPARQDRAF